MESDMKKVDVSSLVNDLIFMDGSSQGNTRKEKKNQDICIEKCYDVEKDIPIQFIGACKNVGSKQESYENDKDFLEISEMESSLLNGSLVTCDEVATPPVKRTVIARVCASGIVHRFPLSTTDSFNEVFMSMAECEKVPIGYINMFLNDKEVYPFDTPASVGLTVSDTIRCLVVKEPVIDTNIKLHLQGKIRRERISVSVDKKAQVSVIIEEYTKLTNTDKSKVTLLLDGESLNNEDVVEDLDLEDDDCLDIILKS